jgi:MinD-like ATPase involved in chromosome partitioning or flagellar assembly
MTTIAVTGTKGSPGATTLAVALGTLTAARSPLLVEADPAGGDIALRYGGTPDVGLVTFAASGRRGIDGLSIADHAQLLPCGVTALLAPTVADQAASALRNLGAAFGSTLQDQAALVIIDGGRWDPHSAAADLVGAASAAVLVLRPTVECVEHARGQLTSLTARVDRVIALCVGEHPYPSDEVHAALGVDELYVVADDARAAHALARGARPDGWLRRSSLMRTASALCDHLLERTEPAVVQP